MTRWKPVIDSIQPKLASDSVELSASSAFLPVTLTRANVSSLFAEADTSTDAVRAFVASMIWGFGDVGYGPYRTWKMLYNKGKSGIGSLILEVRNIARESPAQAYKKLKRKVDNLGPSFATKVVYFASMPNNRGPILDSIVSSWLWSNNWATMESPLDPTVWSIQQYEKYIAFCNQELDNLRVVTELPQNCDDRGFIEYLMFTDYTYSKYAIEFPDWVRAIPRSLKV